MSVLGGSELDLAICSASDWNISEVFCTYPVPSLPACTQHGALSLIPVLAVLVAAVQAAILTTQSNLKVR